MQFYEGDSLNKDMLDIKYMQHANITHNMKLSFEKVLKKATSLLY